jgi:hypothetical protein
MASQIIKIKFPMEAGKDIFNVKNDLSINKEKQNEIIRQLNVLRLKDNQIIQKLIDQLQQLFNELTSYNQTIRQSSG